MKKSLLTCAILLGALSFTAYAAQGKEEKKKDRTECCCKDCRCKDCTCKTDCPECDGCRKNEECRDCDHDGRCCDYHHRHHKKHHHRRGGCCGEC